MRLASSFVIFLVLVRRTGWLGSSSKVGGTSGAGFTLEGGFFLRPTLRGLLLLRPDPSLGIEVFETSNIRMGRVKLTRFFLGRSSCEPD